MTNVIYIGTKQTFFIGESKFLNYIIILFMVRILDSVHRYIQMFFNNTIIPVKKFVKK